MADIGVGTWLQCIRQHSRVLAMRPGTVWCVVVIIDGGDCSDCGKGGDGFQLLNDPMSPQHLRDGWSWCPCGFRPFNGPEQAKRKSSEPTTTTRGTEVVG